MNLNHLRIFVAVAEAGSVTRAAQRLKLSQPALSKQLAELEQQLGHLLLDRLPRGVRPTEAGQLLLSHAQRIFSSERIAEAELAELAGLKRGKLLVGASTTIGNYLIPTVFGEFHRLHPEIGLGLEIANTAVIQAAVLDNRVDLGMIEGFVSSDALAVEAIHTDEMVVIVAPSHPWAAQPRVRATELTQVPLIMREEGSGTRDVIEATLRDAGIEVEPSMSLGSTEAVKNAVAAGLGAALVSRLTVDIELDRGRLQVVELEDLQIRRALHLVQLKGKRPSPVVQAFIDLLHLALV